MDVQRGLVARLADDSDYVPRVNQAIVVARAARLPVIYVVIDFRANYAEVNPNNKVLAAFTSSGGFTPGDPAAIPLEGGQGQWGSGHRYLSA